MSARTQTQRVVTLLLVLAFLVCSVPVLGVVVSASESIGYIECVDGTLIPVVTNYTMSSGIESGPDGNRRAFYAKKSVSDNDFVTYDKVSNLKGQTLTITERIHIAVVYNSSKYTVSMIVDGETIYSANCSSGSYELAFFLDKNYIYPYFAVSLVSGSATVVYGGLSYYSETGDTDATEPIFPGDYFYAFSEIGLQDVSPVSL